MTWDYTAVHTHTSMFDNSVGSLSFSIGKSSLTDSIVRPQFYLCTADATSPGLVLLSLRISVRNSQSSRDRVLKNILTYQLSNASHILVAFSPLKSSSSSPNCSSPLTSSLSSLSCSVDSLLHSLPSPILCIPSSSPPSPTRGPSPFILFPLLLCEPLHPSFFLFLIIVLKKNMYTYLWYSRDTLMCI